MELGLDADNSDSDVDDFDSTIEKKVEEMIAMREKVFEDAADNIKKVKAKYKKDYDKKRKTNEVQIS